MYMLSQRNTCILNAQATNRALFGASCQCSTRFEEQNCHLAKVKVDEMFRLVCDVRSEVPAHYSVPSGVVLLVEFLLDECRNVLLDVVLFKCLRCTINRVLLHVLCHVSIL